MACSGSSLAKPPHSRFGCCQLGDHPGLVPIQAAFELNCPGPGGPALRLRILFCLSGQRKCIVPKPVLTQGPLYPSHQSLWGGRSKSLGLFHLRPGQMGLGFGSETGSSSRNHLSSGVGLRSRLQAVTSSSRCEPKRGRPAESKPPSLLIPDQPAGADSPPRAT